jgi:RES domain-containing protein
VETFHETEHDGWRSSGSEVARQFGSLWWREQRSVALLVPSAVTGIDRNLVLNADHPQFGRVAPSPEQPVVWDRRLFVR